MYLLVSCQTTIEFHGNRTRARRAKKKGELYINAYDMGWKHNWQHVFGTQHVLFAILPSLREPPWPPIPSLKKAAANEEVHGSRGKTAHLSV